MTMRRTTHIGNLVFVFLGWAIAAGSMMLFGWLDGEDAIVRVVSAVGGAAAFWLLGDRVRKPRAGEAA